MSTGRIPPCRWEAQARALAELVAEQGGTLEASQAGWLMREYRPLVWSSFLKDARSVLGGRRASPLLELCSLHPKLVCYVDEPGGESFVRCDASLAEATAATKSCPVVDATAASAAAECLRLGVIQKLAAAKPKGEDEGTRWVPWLVRSSLGKKIAAFALLNPRPGLARENDPERYGLGRASTGAGSGADSGIGATVPSRQRRRRKGLSWTTLTAYFGEFARAEAARGEGVSAWHWEEPHGPCPGTREGHNVGCCCQARLRIRPTAAAAAAFSATDALPPPGVALRGQQVAEAPTSAVSWGIPLCPEKRTMDMASLRAAAQEPGCVVYMLVAAGQTPAGRLQAACALEMLLTAQAHDVAGNLFQVSLGLWAVMARSSEDGPSVAPSVHRFLAEAGGRLASVRRRPLRLVNVGSVGTWSREGQLEATGAGSEACGPATRQWLRDAETALERWSPGKTTAWGLAVEALRPSVDAPLLPYQAESHVTAVAIGLAAALSQGGAVHDEWNVGRRRLVLIEACEGRSCHVLLGEELLAGSPSLPPEQPPSSPAPPLPPLSAVAAKTMPESKEDVDVIPRVSTAPAVPLWRQAWWASWVGRPFSFDGCLDLHLAVAAVNIGRHMHMRVAAGRRLTCQASAASCGPQPLRMLDPCLGSGTLVAAALASGGFSSILGSDIRPEWVQHAHDNLVHAGLLHGEQALSSHPPCGHGKEDGGEGARREEAKDADVTSAPAVDFITHDAKAPFGRLPWEKGAAAEHDFGRGGNLVVVANPPWGKRIGDRTDAVAILRTLLLQWPAATVVVISPSIEGLLVAPELAGWGCVQRVQVGARVSLFVLAQHSGQGCSI